MVLSESTAGPSGRRSGGAAFWWRLTDNLFRRLGWYVLPVVILTMVGFSQANSTLELYRSTGTLSASTNPLVPEQQISGGAPRFFESPAGTMSRIINEQLRTDTFLGEVAKKAGLGDEIESGLLPLGIVRSSVWASENGDSILSVNAQWADPVTSHALVVATIDQYQTYLSDTVSSDAAEAEKFYTDQLAVFVAERDAAQAALTSYVAELPALRTGESHPVNVELEIERLSDGLRAAESKIASTQQRIDEATLRRAQQTSEAGRSLTVIDPPQVPGTPESTFMKRVTLVASFVMLGVVIAAAALLVTTVIDQTVASPVDLFAIEGIVLVASVPQIRLRGSRSGKSSRTRLRSRHREPAGEVN